MLLTTVDRAFSHRPFSGLSRREMLGQNGAMVLIVIDGYAVSRIAYEVMHSFTCALPIQLHVLHMITSTEVTGPARPAGPQGARGPKG